MKDSVISPIEALVSLATVVSFIAIGYFMVDGKYNQAMIAWMISSVLIFAEFYALLGGRRGRVIDLRRRPGQNPKESYKNPYANEGYAGFDDYGEMDEYRGFSGEGVGNMRVYQRGESIDYVDHDEH